MTKRRWNEFEKVTSNSFVPDLVECAAHIPSDDLVEMDHYRKQERMAACGGHDPIRTLLAYAQDELIYDAKGQPMAVDEAQYAATPRGERVNVFGLAYRHDAVFKMHKTLADIVVGAAIHLYQTQGWTTVLYDGLRTVEGAYNLYQLATEDDIASGLLAMPGQSAHNKGMAVDSMMIDSDGKEVEMGGHFDHLNMETNSRAYTGDKISELAKHNRLIREAAFLRSAFTQGLLIAPLRSEFWDDRPPENREDLWRVLDSAARCMGIDLLTQEDVELRKKDRQAFVNKWECWSYADFLERWQELFEGKQQQLETLFGVTMPPTREKAAFYHGNYHPIYDRDLRASNKHLTEALIAA